MIVLQHYLLVSKQDYTDLEWGPMEGVCDHYAELLRSLKTDP
jgi:hypothetical protein